MLELIAALIGVVAILAAVVVMLLPSPVRQPNMTISSHVDPGSPAFMAALAGLIHSDVRFGEAIEIINNGNDFLPALVRSINEATRSVTIMNFIWTAGVFSDAVFEAMTAAAVRGVEVRVLTDAQQTWLEGDKLQTFEKAGGRFVQYHRFTPFKVALVNKRTHRRAMVFDGREAYLGGIAIDDTWLGDGRTPGKWRDLMFRVRGAMVASVQSAFADEWYETTGEVLAGDQFYSNETYTGEIPYINIVSRPSEHWSSIEALYLLSIRAAKKSVYIQNPYFFPNSELRESLEQAARSGLDVRIMMPQPDLSPVGPAAEINYSSMLAAGIRLYEYRTLMHTKTITIDGRWSIIGSANFDNRSRHINNENAFGVSDAAFAAAIERSFMKDAEFCREVTKESWGKRWPLRFWYAYLLSLFSKQY